MAPEYNTMEMMICVASRYLETARPWPSAPARLRRRHAAQKNDSPNLIILFEAGGWRHAAPDADLGRRLAHLFPRVMAPA